MPVLKVTGFDGVVPRMSPTLLGENQAQTSNNTKSYSKELRPWNGQSNQAVFSPTLPNPPQTIYKLHTNTDASAWMTWATDVNVAPGPVADQTEGRIYFTGAGIQPSKTNLALATSGGPPYPFKTLPMGVPAPVKAPSATSNLPTQSTWNQALESPVQTNDSVSIAAAQPFLPSATPTTTPGADTASSPVYTGSVWTVTLGSGVGHAEFGSVSQTPDPALTETVPSAGFVISPDVTSIGGSLQTWTYVYTYINLFGTVFEESGPSPPSQLVNVAFGGVVTLTGFAPPPAGGYNIGFINIYRSVSGATTAGYQLVAQIPANQSTFVDAVPAAALGQSLPSLTWTPPPPNMIGLVSLPSGSLAGFVGNTVYFSEPYFPHAWPLQYAISLPHNIVGLGVFGQTLVAATDTNPYAITGSAPGFMTVQIVQIPEPCVSKQSITSDEFGVLYASPNGLVSVGAFSANVITRNLMRRDEWQATNPTTMQGILYDNQYVGVNIRNNSSSLSPVLAREDIPALSFLQLNATCAFLDPTTANLYIASATDGNIYQVDVNTLVPLNFTWTSKRFVFPRSIAWSLLRVDAAYEQLAANAAYLAQVQKIKDKNAALWALGGNALGGPMNSVPLNFYAVNASQLLPIPPPGAVLNVGVTIWADQTKVGPIPFTSFDPVRLPAFRGREMYFTVAGNLTTRAVTFATTFEELDAAS